MDKNTSSRTRIERFFLCDKNGLKMAGLLKSWDRLWNDARVKLLKSSVLILACNPALKDVPEKKKPWNRRKYTPSNQRTWNFWGYFHVQKSQKQETIWKHVCFLGSWNIYVKKKCGFDDCNFPVNHMELHHPTVPFRLPVMKGHLQDQRKAFRLNISPYRIHKKWQMYLYINGWFSW